MELIDKIFLEWVQFIEYVGNFTGLDYEVTNIILFVIIQPLLIIVFLLLWLKEKRKNRRLLNTNKNLPKSNLIYFFWRLSRLLSVLVLLVEIILIYSLYFDIFKLPFKEFIREEIYNSFVIIFPVALLISYNFLIFGKVTVWLKKP
tara:strand:+ start:680 stop:1117 length:438 start_codon:yes stop_codon:yes gene_type:complete